MEQSVFLEAKSNILVDRGSTDVWQVITDPVKIPRFMLGMQAISTWIVGDELRWIGRHEEQPDDNARGTIVQMDPGKTFKFTFYYPGYGYPDEARYYNTVCYTLEPMGGQTSVTVTQGDFSVFEKGEMIVQHSQSFWEQVLGNLKQLLEEGS